jgi:hypothetical protein
MDFYLLADRTQRPNLNHYRIHCELISGLLLCKIQKGVLYLKYTYFPHAFLAYFHIAKKKEAYDITLPVCVSVPPPLKNSRARRDYGNCSLNTFGRQQIHTHQQKNCWTRCFLRGPCRIRYSMCSKRKVGVDWNGENSNPCQ